MAENMKRPFATCSGLFALMIILFAAPSAAQELSPRAYWPAPRGTGVAIIGYSYSAGDVITDPSLPITGVDSKISTSIVAYFQTLSLLGRTSNVVLELPYVWGNTVGEVEGKPARRDFSGPGDIGITLSMNLMGAPTMTAKEFQELRKNPRPILGASLKLLAPTGEYEKDKLINISTNRWAAKTEVGFMVPFRAKLHLEWELGVWFFGDNNDYFMNTTREQNPIFAGEIHLVWRFKAGFWSSLQFNYFQGGQNTIDGAAQADILRESNFGGTLVWPFLGRHALKAAFTSGLFTELGSDYTSLLLSYSVRLR
jgi:hypothetical protein